MRVIQFSITNVIATLRFGNISVKKEHFFNEYLKEKVDYSKVHLSHNNCLDISKKLNR